MITTVHGLKFALEIDNRSSGEGPERDAERLFEAGVRRWSEATALRAWAAARHRGFHDADPDGPIDRLEHAIHRQVTRAWHDPNGFMLTISGLDPE